MDFTLEKEQEAFEAGLTQLLRQHRGQYILQKNGTVRGTFSSYGEAYKAGIDQFGVDGVFLVAKVEEIKPESVSFAWYGGVMFGQGVAS